MSLLDQVMHLFWPASCPLCGRIGTVACRDCLAKLVEGNPPLCLHCFRPFPCGRHGPEGPFLLFAAVHRGDARRLVHLLKFEGVRAVGRHMGRTFAQAVKLPDEAGLIVPVPLHQASKRPFNQALEIARGMSEVWKTPVKELLEWDISLERQVGKNFRERRDLPGRSIVCSGEPAAESGKGILLVDDVCTTGTTLRRCADALCRGRYRVAGAAVWTLTA